MGPLILGQAPQHRGLLGTENWSDLVHWTNGTPDSAAAQVSSCESGHLWPAAAGYDEGIEDGAVLAGLGFAEEQPVFLLLAGPLVRGVLSASTHES